MRKKQLHELDLTYRWYWMKKKELKPFLNTWVNYREDYHKGKDNYLQYKYEATIKIVDEKSYWCLYRRFYNMVSLSIGIAFESSKVATKGDELLYNFKVMIHSVDDSSFGAWFNLRTLKEIDLLMPKIKNWFDTKSVINGDSLISFCQRLGADDIDYN